MSHLHRRAALGALLAAPALLTRPAAAQDAPRAFRVPKPVRIRDAVWAPPAA